VEDLHELLGKVARGPVLAGEQQFRDSEGHLGVVGVRAGPLAKMTGVSDVAAHRVMLGHELGCAVLEAAAVGVADGQLYQHELLL
jgi:hypothetical protein